MTRAAVRILPMQTAGTHHFIERTYREGGAFQWVRETYINAEEAGATRVMFGVEWQAVENVGVYRRLIADNGKGMSASELVEFFNTFGGGGKPIGGAHENFGVGSKTALLPWNTYGIVVVSWVDGDASMIWVRQDPETGEYGLGLEEVEDPETGQLTLDEVYEPYYDEIHGCDWASVKPAWIEDHGTVIVLLGNSASDDTVLGDPNRSESDIKGISSYLNRRLWTIPEGVDVSVDELRTQDRSSWPTSDQTAHGSSSRAGVDRRTNHRAIEGAKYFVTYPVETFAGGKLDASGTVPLADGTEVDWYLWDGQRPAVQSYAAISGFIGAEYKNELYDVTAHHSTYRSFGVSEATVRSRLWIVLRPPLLGDDDRHGVYPRTDRNALLLKGGPNAGGPLPINDWGNQFADAMPPEIVEALKAARVGQDGSLDDVTWRERLADRFGSRWKVPKLRQRKGGSATMEDPAQEGNVPRRRGKKKRRNGHGGGGSGGTTGKTVLGAKPGSNRAEETLVAGGIPTYRKVRADAIGDGMLAAWQPNDPQYKEGVVLVNVEHPVIRTEVEHWQAMYPDHLATDIANEIENIYGEIAVAKVAHSEHLKGIIPSKTIDDLLRSEESLTMSLLGLIAEEAVIAPRIGGKFAKKKAVA